MTEIDILPPLDQKRRYPIPQAARYLACSRALMYKRIADGTLRVLKDGRRTYIPGSEIARLSALPEA